MEFSEAINGERYVYPVEIPNSFPRIVWGKAIFECDAPPSRHDATLYLERFSRADRRWQVQARASSPRIPNPRSEINVKTTCNRGDHAAWRVRVEITGEITNQKGVVSPFHYRDGGVERLIRCG